MFFTTIFKICISELFMMFIFKMHINLEFCLLTKMHTRGHVLSIFGIILIKFGCDIVLFFDVHDFWIKRISILQFVVYCNNDCITFVNFAQLCCIIFKFVFCASCWCWFDCCVVITIYSLYYQQWINTIMQCDNHQCLTTTTNPYDY